MGGVEDEGAKYTAKNGEERGENEEEEERQTARVDFAFHCGKFVIAKTEREEEGDKERERDEKGQRKRHVSARERASEWAKEREGEQVRESA